MALRKFYGLGQPRWERLYPTFSSLLEGCFSVEVILAQDPMLFSDDLQPCNSCFPLKATVKNRRHRIIHMEAGMRPTRFRELCEAEFEDEEGNLFCRYPIHDSPELVAPLPLIIVPSSEWRRQPRSQRRLGATIR